MVYEFIYIYGDNDARMVKEKSNMSASSSSLFSQQIKRLRSDEEKLPNHIIEEIFLRLPVKSLLRSKSLSKQWKSTIETRYFTEKHSKLLTIRRRSGEYDLHEEQLILFMEKESVYYKFGAISLDSSIKTLSIFSLSKEILCYEASNCCDGLFCIFDAYDPFICIVNPITHWSEQIPLARLQMLQDNANKNNTWQSLSDFRGIPRLAFAKTESHGYKLVWLYNSDRYNSDELSPNNGFTKCEVFDFRSRTWRYLASTPSYPIFEDQRPAFVDESLYWLAERDINGETDVIVLDLCTETFRLMSNTPVINSDPDHIDLCNLNDRLCISKRRRGKMEQVIWIYESSDNTWKKIYTIDLSSCSSWSRRGFSWTGRSVLRPSTPLVIYKDKKILLSHRYADGLVIYDPETNSYVILGKRLRSRIIPSYFPTLISHI